jgi:alpha-glucosidase
MRSTFLIPLACLLSLLPPLFAAPATGGPLSVSSPDGALVATVTTGSADRTLGCTVSLDGRELFRFASLGLVVEGDDLAVAPRVTATPTFRTIDESYPWQGARSVVRNHARELAVPLRSSSRDFTLLVRAYDDGVALRYDLGGRELSVSGESTSWILPSGGKYAWSLHNKDYENTHHFTPWASVPVIQTLAPPLTVEFDGVYLSVTEADCRDFPDLALASDGARLSTRFPGQNKPWKSALSPWRAVVVARDLTTLATTDLVKNLCPAPEPGRDFSWVRPGRSLWQWWSVGAPKLEEQTAWFDAAAALGWEYYLIDDGWRKWTAPGKDQWQLLGEAIAYGKSKGVESIVWVDSKEMLQPAARRAYLERVASLGAAGIKIDFLPVANADMIRWYEGALRDTADLRLLCNFHGCAKPTGLERTWPHGNTREAIRGHEYHITRYNRTLPLETDSILPFTRLVAGAADYTPTVFELSELRGYTWAHELAQALVFTSPLIHFADHYKNYLANPAFDLLRVIPTTWDETRVLPGSAIGGKVGFARRKGDTWWIGVVNGRDAATWDLSLSFLSGPAQATLLADVPGKPDAFDRREIRIQPTDTIPLVLPPGGGFVARLSPTP